MTEPLVQKKIKGIFGRDVDGSFIRLVRVRVGFTFAPHGGVP